MGPSPVYSPKNIAKCERSNITLDPSPAMRREIWRISPVGQPRSSPWWARWGTSLRGEQREWAVLTVGQSVPPTPESPQGLRVARRRGTAGHSRPRYSGDAGTRQVIASPRGCTEGERDHAHCGARNIQEQRSRVSGDHRRRQISSRVCWFPGRNRS